jgi:hypothetical protein
MTLESWDNLDRTSTPGWSRHQCQTDANATKAEGADAGDEGAGCEGKCIMFRGPELLHLVITFHVERSFTESPNGSNSMENQPPTPTLVVAVTPSGHAILWAKEPTRRHLLSLIQCKKSMKLTSHRQPPLTSPDWSPPAAPTHIKGTETPPHRSSYHRRCSSSSPGQTTPPCRPSTPWWERPKPSLSLSLLVLLRQAPVAGAAHKLKLRWGARPPDPWRTGALRRRLGSWLVRPSHGFSLLKIILNSSKSWEPCT